MLRPRSRPADACLELAMRRKYGPQRRFRKGPPSTFANAALRAVPSPLFRTGLQAGFGAEFQFVSGDAKIGNPYQLRIGERPTVLWENPPIGTVSVTDTADRQEPATLREHSELNGRPAEAGDLRALALFNYGHFTSMQVRDGCVRGLDLHLDRLDAATRELFGGPLDGGRVRDYLRNAIGGRGGALSVRINVFSLSMRRDHLAEPAAPDVLITVGPAREIGATPVRLKTFRYERVLPHVKHVGTFGLFHHRRLAQRQGFDDALFVDASEAVSEASIWNIGFFDGERVVWPDAPALTGISMQLLQRGLGERGIATASRRVPRTDVGRYRAAFLTNSSCAVRPVAAIDAIGFAVDPALTALLGECYAANPWQRI